MDIFAYQFLQACCLCPALCYRVASRSTADTGWLPAQGRNRSRNVHRGLGQGKLTPKHETWIPCNGPEISGLSYFPFQFPFSRMFLLVTVFHSTNKMDRLSTNQTLVRFHRHCHLNGHWLRSLPNSNSHTCRFRPRHIHPR